MTQPRNPSFPEYSSKFIPSEKDVNHLRLLSNSWYVMAGIQCLGVCVLGITVLDGLMDKRHYEIPTAGLDAFVGLFCIPLAGLWGILYFLTGKSIRQRKRINLCYIMAAITLVNVPFGTILGVFTFLVLSRPTVKATFI